MRWLVRLFMLLLLGLMLVLGALVFLALQDTPLVARAAVLTPAHIERAKRLLERNDPRNMRPGVLRTITISEQDLDLAANYLASQYARGSADVSLQDGAATVRASFELPTNPLGRYVNLDAVLRETGSSAHLEKLHIGRVPVPAFLGNWLVRLGIAHLQSGADYSASADLVKQVRARDGMLQVVFEWSDAAAGELKSALVGAEEQARWQAYQARLVELTAGAGSAPPVSLDQLLVPMLQFAAQRAATASATAENRAVLIVLAFYVNGKGLVALAPQARDWPQPKQRVVTLAGRTDSPRHFMISAALAATAGSPLSDAVGLYKELDDARAGSGFSFNDIAADRAGTRFGVVAAGSAAGADKLRRAMARGLREPDLLPAIKDLPEALTQAEFTRRYGGTGQPAYQKMIAEIERRIAALPLYR